ncbi:MAG TPA: sulfatase-like hydrolase/transferase [Thermoanaerobaculia bacterium]|nr:sulfatase-like hydrolase/transferase [Thermoanaerobaculia bacterium]
MALSRFPELRAGLAGLAILVSLLATASEAQGRPNLVLLTLDTTRADHLGAWGWPHAQTPHLDALAARGVRFVRCDTAAPITLPSHATLLTGFFPPRHGVRDNGTFVLEEKVETVAERLAASGYDTAAVVSAMVLARRHGLGQGFRSYDDDLGPADAAGLVVAERTAEATTTAALGALTRLREPFLLWVHYFDPHEEYSPPAAFAARATGPHRLYDGEISFMDSEIGRFLARLPADTVVVVVGDHGEMLGDHGELTHGLTLGPGARRVPLLLAGPGLPAGTRRDCLVRTADVAPTLLALAGATIPAGLEGRSLLSLARDGGPCERTSYAESFLPFFAYKWYPLRAISDGSSLYLAAPRSSLFDLDRDPAELADLASSSPKRMEAWGRRFDELLAAMGERREVTIEADNQLSEEQRRQLQALGYVGASGGGTVEATLPDPRGMTTIARQLHDAAGAVQLGRCKEVLPTLQSIVKQDPHNFPALTLAGQCLEEAGKLEAALGLFAQASRENGLSAVPIANAAGVLLALGREAEAEREYRRALTLDPTQAESASNLARLLRQRGAMAEALAVLESALRAGGHGPAVYLERGLARAELGRLAEALADFREAARRSPSDPVPLENAARAAYQLGRKRESAQLYEELLRLAEERVDLWKTLGALYLYELGEPERAASAFRRAFAKESDPAERAKLQALLAELEQR